MNENDFTNSQNPQATQPVINPAQPIQQPVYRPVQQPVQQQPVYYQPVVQPVYQQRQQPVQQVVYQAVPVNVALSNELIEKQRIKKAKKKQRGQILLAGLFLGIAIITMLILEGILIYIIQKTVPNFYSLYNNSSAFEYALNIIVCHLTSMIIPFCLMALALRKNFISPFLPAKKMPTKDWFLWIGLGLFGCMIAQLITQGVISIFELGGYELSQQELADPENALDIIMALIGASIIPGIIEEIAFRCCSLGVLRKFGKGFAVFAVSIVFGLIHGNMIQFVFAFCVGLVLGFITIKTDNVIIAMIVHGLNNSLSVIEDLVKMLSNEKTSNIIAALLIILIMALGFAATVILLVRNIQSIKRNGTLKKRKEAKLLNKEPDNNFFVKLLCLLPGLIIPFAVLIIETLSYIQPIK